MANETLLDDPLADFFGHPILPAGFNSVDANGDEYDGPGVNWEIWPDLTDSFRSHRPLILDADAMALFDGECVDWCIEGGCGNKVKNMCKKALERIRVLISYDCWLAETERLYSVVTAATPSTPAAPLIADFGYSDADRQMLILYISGGVPGVTYVLSFLTATSAGQTKRDDLVIKVMP